jgi:hypothetical protein
LVTFEVTEDGIVAEVGKPKPLLAPEFAPEGDLPVLQREILRAYTSAAFAEFSSGVWLMLAWRFATSISRNGCEMKKAEAVVSNDVGAPENRIKF